jgi:hypothetical protein
MRSESHFHSGKVEAPAGLLFRTQLPFFHRSFFEVNKNAVGWCRDYCLNGTSPLVLKSLGFPSLFFVNFVTPFNIILSPILFSCCHIHTIDDCLNYGTLVSPKLEQLTLPESTEGRSPLSVCTYVLGLSMKAKSTC